MCLYREHKCIPTKQGKLLLWKRLRYLVQRQLRWRLKGRKTNTLLGFVDCRSTTLLSRNETTMCVLWFCSIYRILKITSEILLRFLKKKILKDLKGFKNNSWRTTAKNYFENSSICVVYQIENREEVCLQSLYSFILTKTLSKEWTNIFSVPSYWNYTAIWNIKFFAK